MQSPHLVGSILSDGKRSPPEGSWAVWSRGRCSSSGRGDEGESTEIMRWRGIAGRANRRGAAVVCACRFRACSGSKCFGR